MAGALDLPESIKTGGQNAVAHCIGLHRKIGSATVTDWSQKTLESRMQPTT